MTRNKFIPNKFSIISFSVLLFAISSSQAIEVNAMNEHYTESDIKRNHKTEKNKTEKEKFKDSINNLVKTEFTNETLDKIQQTQDLLKKIPKDVLEIYSELGGEIYFTDIDLVEHKELQDLSEEEKNSMNSRGEKVPFASRFVFEKKRETPKLIINIKDYAINSEQSKEVYYEIGKGISLDIISKDKSLDPEFLNLIKSLSDDSDSSDLLFSQKFKEKLELNNKSIDINFIKENLTEFQHAFSLAFSYYFAPDHRTVLELYAPDMFEYMNKLEKGGFEKISESLKKEGVEKDRIDVLKGEKALKASGLVPEHADAFKKIARELNTYVLFRPVNKLATNLIKSGVATKGLNVHGKSSDWGPVAGYIPFDQDLSKKHGQQLAVEKGNLENKKSITEHEGEIGKIPLKLDHLRIEELKENGIILKGKKEIDNGKKYYLLESNNQVYEFRISDENNEVQYKTKEGKITVLGEKFNWRNIEVMAKNVEGVLKPLTADYDLFALAPSLTEIKKQIPQKEWDKVVNTPNSLEKQKGVTNLLIKYGIERKPDSTKGTLSNWQKQMLDRLNEAVKYTGYTGGDVVNHGTEQDNEEFPEKDNEIFIINPEGEFILTKNWEMTGRFIEKNITGKDYLYYFNRSYNKIAPGNKAYIEWTDPITKAKINTIPTSAEFIKNLSSIRRSSNVGVYKDSGDKDEFAKKESVKKIAGYLSDYYNSANHIFSQEKKRKISIFRGIQAYNEIENVLKSKQIAPEYKNYFQYLKERITNQVQLLLTHQKSNIEFKLLYKQLNFTENETDNFEVFQKIIDEK
ncbi:anthrax toxin edema factor (plasmid) [Bacillus anthracis]|uniref:anthrax toxin edema factor n=1 Tax=Bacillus anthracis TaxID=1392 RepID=UPI0007EAFD45|nr:anthrax toxin edema factor [Bacillus anthracis]UKW64629.1 anthrax toxin edema factor [Bacillus anthracis]